MEIGSHYKKLINSDRWIILWLLKNKYCLNVVWWLPRAGKWRDERMLVKGYKLLVATGVHSEAQTIANNTIVYAE